MAKKPTPDQVKRFVPALPRKYGLRFSSAMASNASTVGVLRQTSFFMSTISTQLARVAITT
ncbi:hypothetical protein O5761_18315 [Escherichia coli]|nr:hypothetical protein [Escherichia coli]MCZ5192007.1 hypothetical protein [Escherichia coli]